MDCNKCNTGYSHNNYNVRNATNNDVRSGMHSNMNSNMNRRNNMQNHSTENKSEMCMNSDMECDKMKDYVDHMGPGMGYVPWQKWEEIYEMEKGLQRGTIFCQLDKPYVGRCAK